MARSRLNAIAAAGIVLGLASLASPAAARDGAAQSASAYAPSPEARSRWVEECSERLTAGQGQVRDPYSTRRARKEQRMREREKARASCESYYDSYYDYHAGHYRAWQPGSRPAYRPSAGYGPAGCDPSPDCRRNCTEVVEYEYVDVPVRAAPRPARDKRVPDKRVRLK